MYSKSKTSLPNLKFFYIVIIVAVIISVLSVSVYYASQYSDVAPTTISLPSSSNTFFKIAYSEPQEFGFVVSSVGDNIIAGAPHMKINDIKNVGVAYLFDGITGSLLHTINNPESDKDSMFGDNIVPVGNTGNVVIVTDSAAYLFDGTTGLLLHTIDNPKSDSDDDGGWYENSATSVGNGNIAITAYKTIPEMERHMEESVHIFDGTTGLLLHTINNPDPGDHDDFGFTMASVGNGNMAITAYNDSFDSSHDNDNDVVYVFDNTTGSLLHTIENPDPNKHNRFGRTVVSVDDYNIAITASYYDRNNGDDLQTVYVFDSTTGLLLHTIENPEPELDKRFSRNIIPINNSNIAITAVPSESFDHSNPKNLQTGYIFDGTTGSLLHTIDNPEPDTYDIFGRTVASVDNNNIAITASNFDDDPIKNAETVFVFDGTTGLQLHSIENPEPDTYDRFGDVIVPINNRVVISNPHASDKSENLALFVFENIS